MRGSSSLLSLKFGCWASRHCSGRVGRRGWKFPYIDGRNADDCSLSLFIYFHYFPFFLLFLVYVLIYSQTPKKEKGEKKLDPPLSPSSPRLMGPRLCTYVYIINSICADDMCGFTGGLRLSFPKCCVRIDRGRTAVQYKLPFPTRRKDRRDEENVFYGTTD